LHKYYNMMAVIGVTFEVYGGMYPHFLEERKRKGGGKLGKEKKDILGQSLSGSRGDLSLLMNCSLSEKIRQNWPHNLAVSYAQQTTTSKLVHQNASGIHQNVKYKMRLFESK